MKIFFFSMLTLIISLNFNRVNFLQNPSKPKKLNVRKLKVYLHSMKEKILINRILSHSTHTSVFTTLVWFLLPSSGTITECETPCQLCDWFIRHLDRIKPLELRLLSSQNRILLLTKRLIGEKSICCFYK